MATFVVLGKVQSPTCSGRIREILFKLTIPARPLCWRSMLPYAAAAWSRRRFSLGIWLGRDPTLRVRRLSSV